MVHIPPEEFDLKFYGIGKIVINWGAIEEFISACVIFLYHKCNGKNTITCKKSGMPRTQFSRKLAFLNEMFQLPILAQYSDEGLKLICRAEWLSKHRDTIVHGAVVEFKPDILKFSKHIYDDITKKTCKPKFEYFEYTLNDLVKYENMMMGLASDLGLFVQRLLKELGNQQLDLQ